MEPDPTPRPPDPTTTSPLDYAEAPAEKPLAATRVLGLVLFCLGVIVCLCILLFVLRSR